MIVGELLKKLQKCPQDKEVVSGQAVYGCIESVYIDLKEDKVVLSESGWEPEWAADYNLQVVE